MKGQSMVIQTNGEKNAPGDGAIGVEKMVNLSLYAMRQRKNPARLQNTRIKLVMGKNQCCNV
jgi:hypothetical protein